RGPTPLRPTATAAHGLRPPWQSSAPAGAALTAADVVAPLRHHGERPWGAPGGDPADVSLPPTEVHDDWRGVTVCMHVGDYQATTASLVAELPVDNGAPIRAWIALGSPCVSVYVPTFPPDAVAPELSDPASWSRFAAVRDRVERDGSELEAVRAVLAPIAAALWA